MEEYKSFITNSLSNSTYISEEQFFDVLVQSLKDAPTIDGDLGKNNKDPIVQAANDRLKFFLTENKGVATGLIPYAIARFSEIYGYNLITGKDSASVSEGDLVSWLKKENTDYDKAVVAKTKDPFSDFNLEVIAKDISESIDDNLKGENVVDNTPKDESIIDNSPEGKNIIDDNLKGENVVDNTPKDGNMIDNSPEDKNIIDDTPKVVEGNDSLQVNPDGVLESYTPAKGRTEVVIPSKHEGQEIKIIGPRAFAGKDLVKNGSIYNERDKVEKVTIEEGVETIGEASFANCRSLKEVVMGSITKVGLRAFLGCENLEKVTISGDAKIAGDDTFAKETFAECNKLKEITIVGVGNLDNMLAAFDFDKIGESATFTLKEKGKSDVTLEVKDGVSKESFEEKRASSALNSNEYKQQMNDLVSGKPNVDLGTVCNTFEKVLNDTLPAGCTLKKGMAESDRKLVAQKANEMLSSAIGDTKNKDLAVNFTSFLMFTFQEKYGFDITTGKESKNLNWQSVQKAADGKYKQTKTHINEAKNQKPGFFAKIFGKNKESAAPKKGNSR